MSFAEPIFLALVLLVLPMLWLRRRRQNAVGHSQAGMHKNLSAPPIIGWLPTIFFALAWTALCVALARPMLAHVSEQTSIQTRDFVIATDISGSMWQALSDPGLQQFADGSNPDPADPFGSQQPRRIDGAKKAIKLFVSRRQGDRVGFLVFDTDTYYHWPLSSDLQIILDKADLIDNASGGGTNFEGPSDFNPGLGPLQAAVDHFRKYGKAKTKVLILVTDGEDSISAKRMDELQAQMQALGIKLYVLGVSEGWANGAQLDLRTLVEERMGGMAIPVSDAAQLRAGMDKIDQLEKSAVSMEKQVSYRDVYQLFLAAGIVLWLLYFASAALIREQA